MTGRIRSKLTYANVMATIAVFLALGGGIAWALANNSVKSKHIKDGQVKPEDLNAASKPQVLSYTASTGDNVQEEVIDHQGYRVIASCAGSGGVPTLEFFLEFPEDGRMVGFLLGGPSNDPEPQVSTGPGTIVDGGEVFSAGESTAPAGQSHFLMAGLTYVGSTQGASLNLHLVADDVDDECRLRGTLTPGVVPPA